MESVDTSNLMAEWHAGKFYHAYLLLGQKSESEELLRALCGITDTPRNLVMEIDNEEKGIISIDQIRDLTHSANLTSDKPKFIVLWGAETMNNSASNAILKILEEPPSKVTFLLQTSNYSLPLTIKSRCRLVRLSNKDMEGHTSSYQINMADNLSILFKQIEKVAKDDDIEAYLEELVFLVRNDMLKTKKSSLAEALSKIEQTRSRIKRNANPRLALENLIIYIKDIYERDIFQS